jgi:ABC-2 type transport system permease protein
MIFARIRGMLRKEFIQVVRDKRMIGMLFLMPALQLMVFSYAATSDVRNVPTAVFDRDRTPESRELAARFLGSGYFRAARTPSDDEEVKDLLDRGEVAAVLSFDPGFGADVASGRSGRVQLILDGTDSNTASIVAAYAANIAATHSDELLSRRAARVLGNAPRPPAVELKVRSWFNENLESRNFYVPGIIANLVLIITIMLTSMAVVREREIGTIEQVLVTPIRPIELLLGKTLPFGLIGIANVVVISAVGVFWFDIPIRGNPLVLLLGTLLYLLSTLGAGLLISTVSRTQQQTMMTTFFYTFPSILLSGFAFPIANMPEPVQWITLINPVRHFLVIIRGVFLKGVGIDVLWPQMLGLAVLGVATLALAATRFRKTLDTGS